ncbi:MAG: rod shape-determining protein RodA [Patescibacteria group bacterium]|nr:rod shape-determining protein RodA [Patescibacteria group bacterium]
MLNISLKNFDWSFFAVTVLLICVGLTMIYSVTLSQEVPDYSLLWKQAIFFAIGLILLFVFTSFDYRTLGSLSWLIYFLSLFLLLAVLFFGTTIHGTRGWFNFFGLSFQPVELAKLTMIIFLAKFFSNRMSRDRLALKTIFSSIFLLIAPIALIMLQPDFGSALIIFAGWLLMVWFAGLSRKHALILIILLIIIASISWLFVLQDYQKERFLNFLNSNRDPLNEGYNVRQSIIAVGSGGFLGRGLGFGPQSQLRFLPETSADFIFASLAEELGFWGVLLVVGLYGIFFWRLYQAVKLARDNFSTLLILGISAMFLFQFFINIGMAVGLLPVTGLPLPFISSGGTFLIISLITVGIVESMIMRNKGVV